MNGVDEHDAPAADASSFQDAPGSSKQVDQVDNTCAICLEPAMAEENVTECSPCAHRFCFECIKSWLSHARKCPMCKSPVDHLTHAGVVTTMADLEKAFEASRILAESDRVPIIDELGLITRKIRRLNRGRNELLDYSQKNGCKRQSDAHRALEKTIEKINKMQSLKSDIEDNSMTRGKLIGDLDFRRLLYEDFSVEWKNVSKNRSYSRFTPEMARSADRIDLISPWLQREMKVICGFLKSVTSRRNTAPLEARLVRAAITGAQKYMIMTEHFAAHMVRSGMDRGVVERFQREFYAFASSALPIETFDANSQYVTREGAFGEGVGDRARRESRAVDLVTLDDDNDTEEGDVIMVNEDDDNDMDSSSRSGSASQPRYHPFEGAVGGSTPDSMSNGDEDMHLYAYPACRMASPAREARQRGRQPPRQRGTATGGLSELERAITQAVGMPVPPHSLLSSDAFGVPHHFYTGTFADAHGFGSSSRGNANGDWPHPSLSTRALWRNPVHHDGERIGQEIRNGWGRRREEQSQRRERETRQQRAPECVVLSSDDEEDLVPLPGVDVPRIVAARLEQERKEEEAKQARITDAAQSAHRGESTWLDMSAAPTSDASLAPLLPVNWNNGAVNFPQEQQYPDWMMGLGGGGASAGGVNEQQPQNESVMVVEEAEKDRNGGGNMDETRNTGGDESGSEKRHKKNKKERKKREKEEKERGDHKQLRKRLDRILEKDRHGDRQELQDLLVDVKKALNPLQKLHDDINDTLHKRHHHHRSHADEATSSRRLREEERERERAERRNRHERTSHKRRSESSNDRNAKKRRDERETDGDGASPMKRVREGEKEQEETTPVLEKQQAMEQEEAVEKTPTPTVVEKTPLLPTVVEKAPLRSRLTVTEPKRRPAPVSSEQAETVWERIVSEKEKRRETPRVEQEQTENVVDEEVRGEEKAVVDSSQAAVIEEATVADVEARQEPIRAAVEEERKEGEQRGKEEEEENEEPRPTLDEIREMRLAALEKKERADTEAETDAVPTQLVLAPNDTPSVATPQLNSPQKSPVDAKRTPILPPDNTPESSSLPASKSSVVRKPVVAPQPDPPEDVADSANTTTLADSAMEEEKEESVEKEQEHEETREKKPSLKRKRKGAAPRAAISMLSKALSAATRSTERPALASNASVSPIRRSARLSGGNK